MTVADSIVQTARSQVGYRALPLKHSMYGVPGRDWNGAFVEWVFKINGVRLEATSTVHLLSTASLAANPRLGDIAVYAFPADGETLGQPHVGIVTETHLWRPNGSFRSVEGQTASAKPKDDKTPNGVWERTRFAWDVIGFIRPDLRRALRLEPPEIMTGLPDPSHSEYGSRPMISLSQLEFGKRHRSTEYVQRALGATVGLRGVDRGLFDWSTRAGIAAYQRKLGRTGAEAAGIPDFDTLAYLGAETREFTVRR